MAEPRDTPSISVSLHGVGLELTSTYGPFLEYAAVAAEPMGSRSPAKVEVRAHLDWVEAPPPRASSAAGGTGGWRRRPDRDLYLEDGEARWLRIDDFPALQMSFRRGSVLEVTGRYHFSLGRGGWTETLRRLRHARSLDRLRARRFSTLLYYLVYYPILWCLERRGGWHLLHGAAISSPAGAAVFGGMPGCGKSTLAVSLLAQPSHGILSDNLILYGSSAVLACPELLLLDRESLSMVGEAAGSLRTTGERRVFEREAFRPVDVVLDRVAPRAVFCVERARETSLAELARDEIHRALLAGNTMAKEVRRYVVMTEVLDRLDGDAQPGRTGDRSADLRRLLEGVPGYLLAVGEGRAGLEAAGRIVGDVLAQAGPSRRSAR